MRPDVAQRNKDRAKDRTGQRFGRLIVLEKNPEGWLCQCDCGNRKVIKDRHTKSCGCLQREAMRKTGQRSKGPLPFDLTGQRFGRLVAEKPDGKDSSGYRWQCRCDCGTIVTVQSRKLRERITKSCGCLQKEVATETIVKEHWRRITDLLPEEGELYDVE